MDKKRIWGWWFFDVASQPYFTLMLTFIFGPYIARIAAARFVAEGTDPVTAAAQAQTAWSWTLTGAGLLIAFSAPILGAMADAAGRRLPWVWFFSALYVFASWTLWYTYPDGSTYQMMLAVFAIGFIATEFATIFTNALLPDLGEGGEIGAISGSGFALGYAGGVVSLFIILLFFEDGAGQTLIGLQPLFGLDPATSEGTRFVGPFTAIWYVAFMIPFFLWVREPKAPAGGRIKVSRALGDLGDTIKGLKGRVSLTAFLSSSLFYRDALNGLFGFGGVYATLVLGWSITLVGIFGIIGAISAAVFSWIGGLADRAKGPKPVIIVSILLLIAVCTVILFMSRTILFGIPLAADSIVPDVTMFICGAVIGAAGGTLQAASRTLMVAHADPDRPAQAFGLYALSGKATAFLAPALIGLITWLADSPRYGLAPLIALFLIGLILLLWVRPDGDRST